MLNGRSNLLVLPLVRFCAEPEFFPSFSGALMNRPATNRLRYISTYTLCPPNLLTTGIVYYRHTLTLWHFTSMTLRSAFILASPWLLHIDLIFLVQLSPAQPVTVRPYLCHTVAHDSVGDMFLKNAEEFNIIRLGSIPVNGCISHTVNCKKKLFFIIL